MLCCLRRTLLSVVCASGMLLSLEWDVKADPGETSNVQLPFTADRIRFLFDGSYLVVSKRDGRLERRSPSTTVALWSISFSHPFDDMDVSKDSQNIYVVGSQSGASGDRAITRVEASSGKITEGKVKLDAGVASIAVGTDQRLYLGSALSADGSLIGTLTFGGKEVELLKRDSPAYLSGQALLGPSQVLQYGKGSLNNDDVISYS